MARAFSRDLLTVARPNLLPELRCLCLVPGVSFEALRRSLPPRSRGGPPYWAVPWPGGQGMARFVLDHPELFRGQAVYDLGCGNAMTAVSAMLSGAARGVAVDQDACALVAARRNARLNGVSIETCRSSFEAFAPSGSGVICAGDLWYDRLTGQQALAALSRLRGEGFQVYLADPGRPSRPRRSVTELARYCIATDLEFEPSAACTVSVYRLR